MFVIIFILAGTLVCVSAVYVTKQFHKLPYINKILNNLNENEKSKYKVLFSWFLASLPVILLLVFAFFEPLSAGLFLLHLAAFMGIIGLIFRIFSKKIQYKSVIALCITVIYMCYGWFAGTNVWETDYQYKDGVLTKAQISEVKSPDALRVAVFADAHLGSSFDGDGFAKYLSIIQQKNPDVLLMVGDIVDESTSKEDMIKLCHALKEMKTSYGKFFVYGNHDKGFNRNKNFTNKEFVKNLIGAGVRILEDESVLINKDFYIIGRKDKSDKTRKEAPDLIKNLEKDKFKIIMDHQPNDYDNEVKTNAQIVISGHTHGGQFFPSQIIDKIFDLNDQVYGTEKIQNTNFLVTSGISDWRVHFKTGTYSEYVIMDIYK